MQEIGNVLTVVGILVTLVAYFGQHSGVKFSDLEPQVSARWQRTLGWVRRRLGLSKSVTIEMNGVLSGLSAAFAGSVLTWHPVDAADDIPTRLDKLASNLDSLRRNMEEVRQMDQKRVAEVEQRLGQRVKSLEQSLEQERADNKRDHTAAMRWEVRGLLITLVGAGLSILG